MDLRQLEYVVGVVDEGTFTAAAHRLHVAQPSLSQSIGRLEAELGVDLFQRVGRGVRLTAAGEAFVGPARRLLRDAALARESVRAVGELRAGTLDVVALRTLAADPLATIVGRFRAAHPQVTVRVSEPESPSAVAERVWDGRAEIGLAELPVAREDLVVEPLVLQELVLLRPPGADPSPVAAAELATLAFVTTPERTSTRRHLDEALARAGAVATIAVETDQREAIVPLVLAGAGVALVPRAASRGAVVQGAVIAPVVPPSTRAIGLVLRSDARSPAAARFCEVAHEVAGGEPSREVVER